MTAEHNTVSWAHLMRNPPSFSPGGKLCLGHPQTSHTGTLGEYGTGEGSKKERLEATSLFLTPGYISGPTLGCPGPSGQQRMRTLEMSEAPTPAGQAAQALTERGR